MNASPATATAPGSFDQLRWAREILRAEGQALLALADRLPAVAFCSAVELIVACEGRLVVSGMGKAGLIGRKLAATFASTGTPSQFVHPAEAVHGDLGCITARDVVLLLSHSGETEEVTRVLSGLRASGARLIAITSYPESTLGLAADVVLDLGVRREACWLGLAPTTSTTAMLGLGDALALVVSRRKGFRPEDFLRYHPGGSLGRKLTKVEEVMRPLSACRVAIQTASVREVLVSQSRPGRRTGAIMLVDEVGVLRGIFTDSDLARLVAQSQDAALDQPICRVMTHDPKKVLVGQPLEVALQRLEQFKISELPVVDDSQRAVGLIDVTDVIGLAHGPRAAHAHGDATPTVTVRLADVRTKSTRT